MSEARNSGMPAEYFRPISEELWGDPVLGPVLRRLKETDPDVIEAVIDVDRSQIRDALDLTPTERLERAFAVSGALEGYRRVEG